LCEVRTSANSLLSSWIRWAGVEVSTKADRAGMSIGNLFVNGRIVVGKLSRVGHSPLPVLAWKSIDREAVEEIVAWAQEVQCWLHQLSCCVLSSVVVLRIGP